jgi:hypothetical protein
LGLGDDRRQQEHDGKQDRNSAHGAAPPLKVTGLVACWMEKYTAQTALIVNPTVRELAALTSLQQ